MLYRLLFLLIMACFSAALHAGSKLSPETRRLLAMQSEVPTRSVSAVVQTYIHLTPGADVSELTRLGVEVNLHFGDIVTARVPVASLQAVSDLDCVTYVQVAQKARPMMDLARVAGRVDLLQQGSGLPQAYDGTGVVVGIIDSGFDYTHPNFYDADGNVLRIKRVWEQSYQGGTPPEGFTYGTEMTTPEQILAAAGDVVTVTHGSHVAGIAAGADRSLGDYHGVAPNADLVLVSIDTEDDQTNVNISDAIAYIYSYAESVGKPCVINMSLGMHTGPHDGTSTFDVIADGLQGPGRLLVGSMGNFGATALHTMKNYSGTASDTLRTFVDYLLTPSTTTVGGDIDIWATPGMAFSVKLFTYSSLTNERVDSVAFDVPASADATMPDVSAKLSGSTGSVSAYGEISPLNGKGHVLISSAITGFRRNYMLGFEIVSKDSGTVNVWCDGNRLALTSNGVPGYSDGDTRMSPAEIGGTGHNIISVGAYVTRNTFETTNNGEMTLEETVGDLAHFSSCGPTADKRMKPDVTAPGCAIISSVSSHYASMSTQPIAASYEWNGKEYTYAYMQGTSMSSPFVAGVVATWLEANPQLTPDDVRNILRTTSIHDDFTGTQPGNEWGYGKIDAWAGAVEALNIASSINSVSDDASDIRVESVGGGKVRVYADSEVNVGAYSINGVAVMSGSLSAADAESGAVIDLSGLDSGVYLLRLATATHSVTRKITLR